VKNPDPSRMGFLTFITVSVATMFGVVVATLIASAFVREDGTVAIGLGLFLIPIPSMAAALAFLFVARFESGRKGLGALVVFFGTLASTILFTAFGALGLILAAVAAGGFGVLARRLLDSPARA